VHAMHRTDLTAMDHGGASPKDISAGLSLSPSATTAMLDRLERAGHVGHRPGARGRRLDVRRLDHHMRTVLDTYDEDELVRTTQLMRRLSAATRAASTEAR
jgi:DNA-binding MarR family transcriptional regulator